MRQSNVIFGTLIFMFIVYITMRGQLPAYLDLFKSKKAGEGSKKSSGGSILGDIKDTVIDKGKDVLDNALDKGKEMLGNAAAKYLGF